MEKENNIEYNLNLTKYYCDSLPSLQKKNAEILRTINLKLNNIELFSFKEMNLYNNGKTIVTDWKTEPISWTSSNIEILLEKQLEFKKKQAIYLE